MNYTAYNEKVIEHHDDYLFDAGCAEESHITCDCCGGELADDEEFSEIHIRGGYFNVCKDCVRAAMDDMRTWRQEMECNLDY